MTIENRIENFKSKFCTYTQSDIQLAIETALAVDEDENWLYDEIMQFSSEYSTQTKDIDPVCIAYVSIFQAARSEIKEKTGLDLYNDIETGDIKTCGNYLDTRYDCSFESCNELKEKLIKKGIKHEDLSQKTNWFLSELEIDLNK